MEKKNIDWSNLGFSYLKTDKRFVSNYKDGAWDKGALTGDDQVTINECAGVLLPIMISVPACRRSSRFGRTLS